MDVDEAQVRMREIQRIMERATLTRASCRRGE
jgi:hypothetical protein